jgi:DNA excision repair protein ERCC-3
VSVGLTQDDILKVLRRLAKNEEIPKDVVDMIQQYSSHYGKARLVLKEGRLLIETFDESIRDELMRIPEVREAHKRIVAENERREKERLRKD